MAEIAIILVYSALLALLTILVILDLHRNTVGLDISINKVNGYALRKIQGYRFHDTTKTENCPVDAILLEDALLAMNDKL